MRIAPLVRLVASVLTLAIVSAACGSATSTVSGSTATPATAVSASQAASAWVQARVEQPASIEAVPTNAPVFCSPCHPIVGTYIDALVKVGDGYLALGESQPPARAIGWSSTDGRSWANLQDLPSPPNSSIQAAVVGGDQLVAAGTSGGVAAIWRTTDGSSWTLTTLPAPPAGSTETLDTVTYVTGGLFVAGGYELSATNQRTATLWRSAGGSTWTRAQIGPSSGTGAGAVASTQVTGIAGVTGDLVAVGYEGDNRRGTGIDWSSTDGGATWRPIASPELASGRPLAVVAAGLGFVAVGESVDQTAAAAWSSTDGSSWIAAADEPALQNEGMQMVMTAVAVAPGAGVIAAGWRTDAGNGSAVVWRSADGLSWTRLPQDDTFSGAGLSSLIASPRLMVGGTMGWPDTHAAEVWIAPGS